jgi:GNAT superfamily N-acetyltransferase
MTRRKADLAIEPVTVDRLADLDELFASGDPRWCQCAYMRLAGVTWSSSTPAANRAVHREAIEAARAQGWSPGLIAYRDGQAVGWVSFDRREAYERLATSRLLRPVDDREVWSVVCFVVAASARRSGVASRLLDAAIDYARHHGVRLLEAYPVDVSSSTSRKRSSADLWRGTVPMFERAGFTTVEVRRQHSSAPPRPIMRRAIRAHSRGSARSPRS